MLFLLPGITIAWLMDMTYCDSKSTAHACEIDKTNGDSFRDPAPDSKTAQPFPTYIFINHLLLLRLIKTRNGHESRTAP